MTWVTLIRTTCDVTTFPDCGPLSSLLKHSLGVWFKHSLGLTKLSDALDEVYSVTSWSSKWFLVGSEQNQLPQIWLT